MRFNLDNKDELHDDDVAWLPLFPLQIWVILYSTSSQFSFRVKVNKETLSFVIISLNFCYQRFMNVYKHSIIKAPPESSRYVPKFNCFSKKSVIHLFTASNQTMAFSSLLRHLLLLFGCWGSNSVKKFLKWPLFYKWLLGWGKL